MGLGGGSCGRSLPGVCDCRFCLDGGVSCGRNLPGVWFRRLGLADDCGSMGRNLPGVGPRRLADVVVGDMLRCRRTAGPTDLLRALRPRGMRSMLAVRLGLERTGEDDDSKA